MPNKSVAIDLGSHTKKVLAVQAGKSGLAITRFAALPAEESLASCPVPLTDAVVGLAGRDMVLRYSQVPPSPDWQLKNLMDLEIQDLSTQSGGELSADYNILPIVDEEGGMETVLMALARNDALARMDATVKSAQGSIAGYVPNCIALYNAYLKCGPIEEDAVVCLCNLGHETIDIALVKGTDLLFARNLTGGAKVFDDAIAAAFNVSPRKAEQLKKDLLDLDPASRGSYASGQAEKVTMAAGGAAQMIVSAIQSSVAFCQSQTKIQGLRLDKVWLAGGGALLRGLPGFVKEALRCTVQPYDPFATCDLSKLPPDEAEALEQNRPAAVVALGLAAGKVDDSLYSLEILPESVKRKKRFQERTVFNIVAGIIGVAVLAVTAYASKGRQEKAETEARQVAILRARWQNTDSEAQRLFEENEKKRELVAVLAEKTVPLDGAVRTLRALRESLPAELWIDTLEVTRSTTGGGRAGKPIVQVSGLGKELGGSAIEPVYQDFRSRFGKLIPQLQPQDIKAQQMADRYQFTFQIDFQRDPASEAKKEDKK